MRKIISKIAGLMLGLSLAAGVGAVVFSQAAVSAEAASPATLTFTAKCNGSGTDSDGNTWTVTSDGTESTYDATKGIHYGTSSAQVTYIRLSTSGISGTITQVVVNASAASGVSATVGVKVGGSQFGDDPKSLSTSATNYTFSGSSSGSIEVEITKPSKAAKAIYCKSISVTYSSGGGGTDPVLQSIAVSNEKTAYVVGDEFVKPTVTATYDKGDPQDVTESATFSGYNMSTAGDYTVTVSYSGKTTTYSISVAEPEPEGEVLYNCDFTTLEAFGYTQDKEFTLNSKVWTASVAQLNGGIFYLGCNGTHAAKGVLNDNSNFADVVTALAAVDSTYNNSKTTAHAYALRFNNAYSNVGKIKLNWSGTNNGFQVYLFGDQGSGLISLGHAEAENGATSSGSISWTATNYGENFDSIVAVARPGASGSTAASKTIRFSTFTIYEGEAEPVDPTKKDMVIYTSGNPAAGGSFYYSKNAGTHVFTAKEGEDTVSGVTWSVSDETVATINNSTGAVTTLKPGDVTIYAEAEGYNKASAAVHFIKGALEEIAVTGSMSKTAYTTNDSWSNAGLTATGTYHSGWTEDITSTAVWTYSPASPTDGVTNVVATATLDEISGSSSAQSVSVTVAHAGTAADPFTVAEALAKANEIGAVGNTGQGPWVTKGIISRVTSAPAATYWNATYYISDDGTQNNELQVYRGFYLNNAKFDETTAALLTAGKIVTVTGNLTGSYGCEYCANNYLLALEEPDTGDVDVTFTPSITSYEIGASGTFSASSETQGVTYSWSVDKSDVLTVNASTGAFQAVGLGVARVTVTATANEKEGYAFADITVNGASTNVYSVSDANAIASGVTSGQTTSYYIYVEGYVKEFGTSMSGTSPRAFDITSLDESSSIMVYTNVNPYSSFIEGLSLGDYIVVKANVQNYSGTYELTSPEKISSSSSAMSFALDFMSQTDAICTGYVDGDDNSSKLGAIWDGFATSFGSLTETEQGHLVDTTGCGSTILNAMARYDYLVRRYSNLDRFVTNRVINGAPLNVTVNSMNNNSSTIVIVVVALTSITSIGVLLVIKRKRSLVK